MGQRPAIPMQYIILYIQGVWYGDDFFAKLAAIWPITMTKPCFDLKPLDDFLNTPVYYKILKKSMILSILPALGSLKDQLIWKSRNKEKTFSIETS